MTYYSTLPQFPSVYTHAPSYYAPENPSPAATNPCSVVFVNPCATANPCTPTNTTGGNTTNPCTPTNTTGGNNPNTTGGNANNPCPTNTTDGNNPCPTNTTGGNTLVLNMCIAPCNKSSDKSVDKPVDKPVDKSQPEKLALDLDNLAMVVNKKGDILDAKTGKKTGQTLEECIKILTADKGTITVEDNLKIVGECGEGNSGCKKCVDAINLSIVKELSEEIAEIASYYHII